MLDRTKELPLDPPAKIGGVDVNSADGARTTLVNGDDKFPPETPEALIDRLVATGRVAGEVAHPTAGFDWSPDGPDRDSIVCFRQPATAVYENTAGNIVIRQEANWNDDEDSVTLITTERAGDITDAVMKLAREIGKK